MGLLGVPKAEGCLGVGGLMTERSGLRKVCVPAPPLQHHGDQAIAPLSLSFALCKVGMVMPASPSSGGQEEAQDRMSSVRGLLGGSVG